MVMTLAFHTKDPDRVKGTLNIFLFTNLYSSAGLDSVILKRKWDAILGCRTFIYFVDMSLLMGKQKVSPIAGWYKAKFQIEARRTPTVKIPSPKTVWGKDIGISPPERQSLVGISTLSPT